MHSLHKQNRSTLGIKTGTTIVEATADSISLTPTVDWTAAVWASLLAGLASFLLYLFFVPAVIDAGNAAAMIRYIASPMLGPEVLPPPATFTASILLASVVVHFTIALAEGLIIAFVLHRWGLVTGVAGGAAFGLIFFLINFYSLTFVYPHMFAMAHWSVLVVHIIFGALAGGIYELLEMEPYERAGDGEAG